jgi:hypothetical protein
VRTASGTPTAPGAGSTAPGTSQTTTTATRHAPAVAGRTSPGGDHS